jgi:hypothetical protein
MRALTVEEKETIRVAKKKVNEVINQERKSLSTKLKEEMKGRRGIKTEYARTLELKRSYLKPITGDPVHLKNGESQILIDYQLIRKAMRLTKSFQRKVFIGRDLLVIEYAGKNSKGSIEVYQFQGHERLENLPVIDMREGVH